MTETMLVTFDKQMALSDTTQNPGSSSLNKFLASGQISSQSEIRPKEPKSMPMSTTKKRTNTLTYIFLLLRIIG